MCAVVRSNGSGITGMCLTNVWLRFEVELILRDFWHATEWYPMGRATGTVRSRALDVYAAQVIAATTLGISRTFSMQLHVLH